jgi:hypothetical protein
MWYYFKDCRSDEYSSGGGQLEVHNLQVLSGTYDNTNGLIGTEWNGFYRLIHRANAVIENGSKMVGIDQSLQNRLIGEAKFLRAWAYFELVTNWEAVPLYTETVTSAEGTKALASESEIYTLLISDLTAIQSDLLESYTGNDIGRATKDAARLLLARTYMHQGNYTDAKTELLKIYDSPKYGLMDDYSDNFTEEKEYNKESIFEIGFNGTTYYWDGEGNTTGDKANMLAQEYSPVGWRNLIPSDKLLDEYERPYKGDAKEDPRLRSTVYFTGDTYGSPTNPKVITDGIQNGYSSNFNGVVQKISWKKWTALYKVDQGGYYTSAINFRMMRFAEVILKLAECENEIGTSTQALIYLNQIRDRASVSMEHYPTARYTCSNKAEIMHAIMHESKIELAGEKIRAIDILRWRKNGKFNSLDPEPIPYIAVDANKALLPIPSTEISANSKL